MAGGPIYPYSPYPLTPGLVFDEVWERLDATQDTYDIGFGLAPSPLGQDAIWHLDFDIPPEIPTGAFTLRLKAVTGNNVGSVDVNPRYRMISPGQALHGTVLLSQGTNSLAWSGAPTDGVLQELKIPLTVIAPVTNAVCKLELVFESTSTLGDVSIWWPTLIWE